MCPAGHPWHHHPPTGKTDKIQQNHHAPEGQESSPPSKNTAKGKGGEPERAGGSGCCQLCCSSCERGTEHSQGIPPAKLPPFQQLLQSSAVVWMCEQLLSSLTQLSGVSQHLQTWLTPVPCPHKATTSPAKPGTHSCFPGLRKELWLLSDTDTRFRAGGEDTGICSGTGTTFSEGQEAHPLSV